MSEDKMIGMIDAKLRSRRAKKSREWGQSEYKRNPDGSTQGYEEYFYPVKNNQGEIYELRGAVRWWRK